MASYKVEISATAERQLRKLPKDVLRRVVRALEQLSDDPYPPGSRKLTGWHDTFRIRIGTHRILYVVHKEIVTIIVLKIGHRKDVYR
jgi:mRNA interferase RelE/StbE